MGGLAVDVGALLLEAEQKPHAAKSLVMHTLSIPPFDILRIQYTDQSPGLLLQRMPSTTLPTNLHPTDMLPRC